MTIRSDEELGALPSVLLPPSVHAASAAILVVDLDEQTITYANDLAVELVPDRPLPVAVDAWSEAAGLEDVAGEDLPTSGDPGPSRSRSLLRVAQGEPVLGEGVTARRATAMSGEREPLWVVGIPMVGAPAPFATRALVAFLPLRNAALVAGAQQAAAVLRDRAVAATKVSFTITDPSQPDNPLVWVNPAFTETTGYTFEDAVGRNCRFLQGERSDQRAVADIRRSLAEGRPITTTLVNYRKDGSPFWNELSISPVRDGDGAVTHFVGVQADVTARVQAQTARDDALARAEQAAGRMSLLADYATRLTSSLDNTEIVSLLLDVLVPRLATWCAVHLADEAAPGAGSVLRHARGDDAGVAEAMAAMRQSLLADGVPTGSPTARVLRGELPYLLVRDVAADPAAAGAGEDARSALSARLGAASVMVVPLRSRTRVLGAVALMANDQRAPYDGDDLALARELAGRTALMLENSMLYTRERAAAVTLQRSMMPAVPQLPGLTMAARYLTAADEAAVGGDWYDVFELEDGGIGVAVGDAMGHNVDSAASMGKLSTMLRSYGWPGAAPGAALDAVDALLAGTRLDVLATCCYGRLRLGADGARFEYANAGHPPLLVRHADGTVEALDAAQGPMLGISQLRSDGQSSRPTATLELEPGATLLLYTDGLTDSVEPELDTAAAAGRLAEVVAAQPVGATPRQLVRTLGELAHGGRTDDVVVVAIRID